MSREERWQHLLEVGNTLREEMRISGKHMQAHHDAISQTYTLFGMLATIQTIKENPNKLNKIEEFANKKVDDALDHLDSILKTL
jgi:hypothetical protein